MGYHGHRIFKRFNNLVEKLNDTMDPCGSLVKLGKATEVEKRYIDIYIKGMNSIQSKYFYYKSIVSGKKKYISQMGKKQTYKNRAMGALAACHRRASEIEKNFSKLINVEIPERYQRDLSVIFDCQELKNNTKNMFLKTYLENAVSLNHVFDHINDSIVSDCEMLGFCVCFFSKDYPFSRGCIESDIQMPDDSITEVKYF